MTLQRVCTTVRLLSVALIPLSTLFIQPTAAQSTIAQCTSYPGGICSGYVDYPVYLPANTTFEQIEQQLLFLNNVTSLVGDIYYACAEEYYRYICPFYYAKCSQNNANTISILMGCESSCQSANKACSAIFSMLGQPSMSPDCSAKSPISNQSLQPDASCNEVAPKNATRAASWINLLAVTPGTVFSECPAPFVKDPLAKAGTPETIDAEQCLHGCCTPCPTQDYFFPEGWTEQGFLATDIIRSVSAIFSFLMFVSYLVLSDKRRHPSILVLNVALSVFLFSVPAFFALGDPKRIQCASDGIRAADQDNNLVCAAQGAILIFASFASVMWCTTLIVNLHLLTVWNSHFLNDKYIVINVIGWGVPASIMSIALGLHAVKFEFAHLCLVSLERIFEIFFYPMAAIVCPAFLIHVATFCFIAKVALRSGLGSEMSQSLSQTQSTANTFSSRQIARMKRQQILQAFKIQWRAVLLATVMTFTVLFYMIFYFTQVNRINELQQNVKVTVAWLECMMTPSNDQNSCVSVISGHLPPFSLMMVAETLVSLIGTSLFFNFAKRSMLREWYDWIYRVRVSAGLRGRVEKDGDQFFAI